MECLRRDSLLTEDDFNVFSFQSRRNTVFRLKSVDKVIPMEEDLKG